MTAVQVESGTEVVVGIPSLIRLSFVLLAVPTIPAVPAESGAPTVSLRDQLR